MTNFRFFSVIMVGLGFLIGSTGCGMKKQVRFASGPPNVAVSAQTLNHMPEPQSAQVTYSNNTRYVQVNEAEQ